jgi:uncharacterized protein (TIGR02611 family)
MSDATLAPRTHALLSRVDAWADHGTGRRLLLKVGVTVAGPLVVLAGVAMLVLPGPGLVVIAAGVALLALEYPWARHALTVAGGKASRMREAVLPKTASRGRRAIGGLAVAAVAAAGFVATSAATALLGAYTVL